MNFIAQTLLRFFSIDMQCRQSGEDEIWVLFDADNGIQIGPTRVFDTSVCTQGITKLANVLCLDWDQTGSLEMLIRVFALITSMLDSFTCTMWLK